MNLLGGSNDGAGDITNGFVCRGSSMTNGCMTDNATLGDLDTPAKFEPENPMSFELWKM